MAGGRQRKGKKGLPCMRGFIRVRGSFCVACREPADRAVREAWQGQRKTKGGDTAADFEVEEAGMEAVGMEIGRIEGGMAEAAQSAEPWQGLWPWRGRRP